MKFKTFRAIVIGVGLAGLAGGIALCLSRALDTAARRLAAGERETAALIAAMRQEISGAPLARVDYAEIVDNETFEPVASINRTALALLAVHVGSTRLIDNALLTPQGHGD